MAKASPILNSFNAGELSPTLLGRVDLDKYPRGCSTLVNWLPQIHGPLRKRPGTRFINEVKDSANPARIIPFEYSIDQAYVLEFGEGYVRFYANGGIVLDGGVPYEIASPYSAVDLALLDYAQSADVVYLAHPDYPPHKLSRFGPTDWTLDPVDFDWPPFDDENTTDDTITPSGVTGSITLTASVAMFTPDSVGQTFKFIETPESKYNKWTPSTTISTERRREYIGNVYRATATGTTGVRPPVHTEGTEGDGSLLWDYLHSGSGYCVVTSYVSDTVVNATVVKEIPSLDSPPVSTKRWAKGAWSAETGYPRAVTFYEDRLWFAGSTHRPQTLWASVTSDYENHQYGTNDDDALNYTINSQDQNTIMWLSPGKVLAVGTANGEFTLSAQQISDPVTPTNVRITPQTTYGSAVGVRPLRIGPSILFAQKAGQKVREYTYNFETDAYVAPNLNVLSDHIALGRISEMTYQQEPYQIVWCALNDGSLIGLTYERQEDVVGWHRQVIGGNGIVESLCTIPHWGGDQDVTFMVVRRTINGSSVRYIEYIDKYMTGDYALFMDCALTYVGAPTTTITGLDHLIGETVVVLADGAVHPSVVVSGSGSITLNREATVVNVGLSYLATYESMPIEAGARDGVAQGKQMRINNLVVRLHQTGPGLYYGPTGTADLLYTRSTTDPMDVAVPLFSGFTDILPWPEGYEQGPQIRLEHRLPTPCTIVALMPQLHTYDR